MRFLDPISCSTCVYSEEIYRRCSEDSEFTCHKHDIERTCSDCYLCENWEPADDFDGLDRELEFKTPIGKA